ncbi:MAG: sulfatase-like hydrolase/transferase [Lachnospiraceae bacterium]|nr:sulfatase-like hydrolase/transferase [Lachnospiraceae bacterium]
MAETIKNRSKGSIIFILFLIVTFFIFGPLSLYLTNVKEFWFGLSDVLRAVCICSAIALLILIVIAFLLPGKVNEWFICLLFGGTLALYIQGNFVNTDYGTLDGTAIDWSQYRGTAVWNTIMWIVCLAAPFVLRFFVKRSWKKILTWAALGLILVQVITLVTLFIMAMNDPNSKKNVTLSTKDEFTLSEEGNVVVFIVDTYDSRYFNSFIENNRDFVNETLEDFTYFSDTTCGAARTVVGVPYILTEQAYTTEGSFPAYIKGAYEKTDLYDALTDNGYDIGLYLNGNYVSPDMVPDIRNATLDGRKIADRFEFTKQLYKLTCFKYFPHVLKPRVWMYTQDFDRAADMSSAFTVNDPNFYKDLTEQKVNTDDDKKVFVIYHLLGVHSPYTMNEYAEYDGGGTDFERQEKGTWRILTEYMQQMKDKGVYDNTSIIILADHGEQGGAGASLLLVKLAGEHHPFEISDVPASYAQLHNTFKKAAGIEYEGKSVFELTNEDNKVRIYDLQNQDDELVEFEVRGPATDPDSYKASGNRYKMFSSGEGEDRTYHIGDEIGFGSTGEGGNYKVSGFAKVEADFTWTLGNECQLSIPLNEEPEADLVFDLDLRTYMGSGQHVKVFINGTLLDTYYVDAENPDLYFIIPKSMVPERDLDIRMELPDAVAPADVSDTAKDKRLLSLCFDTLKISYYEPETESTVE